MAGEIIIARRRVFLDLRPVMLVIGALVSILGLTMLVPAFVDFAAGNPDWQIFLLAFVTTFGFGALMFAATRGSGGSMTTRQAFVMTTSVWITLAGFGALPLYWSGIAPTFTDAYFEAMSGFTTTGATVLTGLDDMPPGILLWRGMMQWLGGLGIIVMAVAVLPMLQIGGMQLFKAEAFDTPEKILPRAREISGAITLIFVNLTLLCMFFYLLSGMSLLDAVVHAMTTVATGGFSNHDASLGYFDSAGVDVTAAVFMIIGSLPFLLYVQALQGSLRPLAVDSQVRTFLALLSLFIVIAWAIQQTQDIRSGWDAARYALVNVTSIMTGAGFATDDYDAWGPASVALFFFITFIGGCAGSTSCGMKVFRVQVLAQTLRQHVASVLYPHGVFTPRFNGKPIPDRVVSAVMSFFFLYIATFAVSAIALSLTGVDAQTALSAAGTAIANVGPGIGERIGPAGNYQTINDTAKWILSATMLIGRLELFTVLVMLSPRFWRM
ncbi:TrkH family potassium uptake protein [Rhizobiaceae bacterium]|nr:TrkH family potassium uptake protein [Rhizobiaceae bacterium]